jgi:hypothetical protein
MTMMAAASTTDLTQTANNSHAPERQRRALNLAWGNAPGIFNPMRPSAESAIQVSANAKRILQ